MIYKEKEIKEFQEWFCDFHSVSMKILQRKSKINFLVFLRISFAEILLEHRVSTVKIGKLLNRNHSTISYYLHHRIFNKFDDELQEILHLTKKNYYNGSTEARQNNRIRT